MRRMHAHFLLVASVMIALVGGLVIGGATATAKKKPATKVKIKFGEDDGQFTYEVTVKKPKKCRKNRKVTVYHDENGNGKLDEGEFVIDEGKTNKKGRFRFESEIAPPEGDTIGVEVTKNKKCKGGSASIFA